MLDAFIIDKIKKEKEKPHVDEWQPLPLEIPAVPQDWEDERANKKKDRDQHVIQFVF